MSALTVSLIVFASVFAGAVLGLLLHSKLPPHHLKADSRDVVGLGMGLVGTMAALVLGLLVASAKGSYDSQSNELTQLSANLVLLDRTLFLYGPEAKTMRDQLRGEAARICDHMWSKDHSGSSALDPSTSRVESLYNAIQRLSPKDDMQRSLQVQALNYANFIGQTRWLIYAQSGGSVPLPLLVVLVLWLTILFISFGLFAPRNATVVTSLFISALSVSCAILLILEMYKPFEGLIRIPSAPLRAAVTHIGE